MIGPGESPWFDKPLFHSVIHLFGDPACGHRALEQIAGERNVRRRESAQQNNKLGQIVGKRNVRGRQSALADRADGA